MSTNGNGTDPGVTKPQEPASLSGMVATLAPVAVISAVYLVIFLVLRVNHRRYYAPRTYIGSLKDTERSPPLPNGYFNWFKTFWKIPDVYALQHQSLDAYLYLRFLRMAMIICLVGCLITWPILFPINATGGGGQSQLDILSYANISNETQSDRYYATVFVVWIYFGFIMYLIMREIIFYINLRQAFLMSPFYSNRISSRTVLFTSVPSPYLTEAKLRQVFGPTVKQIWITGETKELEDLVKERDKVAMKLEKAEVKLIKLVNKERQTALKKGTASPEDASKILAPGDAESGSVAARWIPNKKRPSHRLGPLGLIGKKVDTINWCRQELARLIPETEAAQAKYRAGNYKKIPSVFIEFRTQADAEGAAQILAHHQGLHMTPKYIGVRPNEIVWRSLAIPWWQRVIRQYLVYAFIAVMILFWAIPVGVVGAISNINALMEISWLQWLSKIPSVIMGVITGLLPSVALSILMSLVPVVMRLCAKLAGEPSLSRVELFTQNAYFAFQVIQVFLITTMTSSAAAVAYKISQEPMQAPAILASNLPKASNIYISYFIVQGLTIATSVLTQVVGFVIFTIIYKFLTGTPRAMYNKWTNLSAISWGSTLPVYTNIVVIAITYSGIAPLMLGWATLGLALFYLAWRYNIFFVTDTQIDTRGLIYPRAIKQLFTGLYLAEICMIGLLGASVAPGPLVLMVIFLVFTVLFHLSLNKATNPLLYNLPLSLMAEEESRLIDPEAAGGVDGAKDGGVGPSANLYKNGHNGNGLATDAMLENAKASEAAMRRTASGKKPNMLTRFLKPWIYSDYMTLRALVPRHLDVQEYPDEVHRDAYAHPSVSSTAPLLWIPTDQAGVSKQEVDHTSRVIPITDEGCEIDEKGHLVWDTETSRPPVWEEKIYY